MDRIARSLALGLVVCLACVAHAQPVRRYDVSYLWRATLPQAQAREKQLSILGPRVARQLRIVVADGGYGVIYLREGDAHAASLTASVHRRLLKRKHLGSAWPVPSRAWIEVAQNGSRRAQPKAERRRAVAAQTAERSELEALIDQHVKAMRRRGHLAADERTAWSVYDFTTGETLVEINADLELQTASLVKPFLALAFMSQVQRGKLAYDAQSRRQMRRMIQVSDNRAADWVMRRLGGPAAVQRLLRDRFGSLLPGVKIREYIPRSGRTYRNKATARDYSRFLLALWRDDLPGSDEIKRLMALPKKDRLRTGVPLPRDIEVYDKTGSTSHLCGDIGVLTAKGPDGKQYAYTLVGIIEKRRAARHYFRWLRSRGNVIRDISYLVYHGVGAMHGFASPR